MKTSMRLATSVRRAFFAAMLAVLPSLVLADTALGPFKTAEDLESARHILEVDGNEVSDRVTDDKESLGFIVVTRVLGENPGKSLVDEMKAGGVRDVVYVGVGVYEGRVSAGVYATEGNARLRAIELGKQGFDFSVTERTRTIFYQGWLDTPARVSGETLDAIEEAVGYSIQVIHEEPEPIEEVVLASVEQDPVPEESEPEPVQVAEPEPDLEQVPASEPEPEPEPEAREPETAPPTMSVTTSTSVQDDGGINYLWIIVIAVLVSAGAAVAYVRYANRPVVEGTLIRFDTDDKAEGPPSEPPPQQEQEPDDEKPPFAELAEAVMSDSVAADSNALLETFAATDIEIVDLIDDLIDLARRKAGASDGDRLTFDLAALIEDVVIDARGRFPENTIKYDALNSLPIVRADAAKIGRIFRNLVRQTLEIDNAAHIEITASYETEPRQLLSICIANEFARLDAGEIEALFDTATTSGMRLSVTRKLAQQIDGDVEVTSEEGKGTTIQLTVPVLFAEDEVLLSNGLTVGELVDSAAVARSEVDLRQEALEEARALLEERTKAFEEAESRAREESAAREQLASETSDKLESLSAELEEARKAAASEQALRGESVAEASEKVEALSAQLEVAIDRAESLEAEGKNQLAALTSELEEARERLNRELSLRESTEVEAAERVRELTSELDQLREKQSEDGARLRAEETRAREEIDALKSELESSRQALSSADQEKSAALVELERRNETLESAVREAENRVAAGESSRRDVEAEAARLKEELAKSREELEKATVQLKEEFEGSIEEKGKLVTDLEAKNDALEKAVEYAQQKVIDDQAARKNAEAEVEKLKADLEASRTQLEAASADQTETLEKLRMQNVALETAIEEAQKKLSDDQMSWAKSDAADKAEIDRLATELASTREELEQLREQQGANVPDLEALQSQLNEATERLQNETTARVRAERDTAREVDQLLNELNKARTDLRKESQARQDAELASEERIDQLSSELEDTRRRLVAESNARRRAEEQIKSQGQQETKEEGGWETFGSDEEIAAEIEETSRAPVKSSMPMNNPILRSMAERFVSRLGEQLESLEDALGEGNPAEILAIANWIKGEAYTLGFHDFTRPASELEDFVKDKEYKRIPGRIVELKSMASRIELGEIDVPKQESPQPATASSAQVLRYKLPPNSRKAEMMENFIAQLGTQLLEMEAAFARNNAKELTRLIRWILKYAGAFGMKEIIDLTEGLQESLEGDSEKTSEKLAELAQVYSTIEVVRS